jgi:hypothetical protein
MKKHSFKIYIKRIAGIALIATFISVNANAAEIAADTALYETAATVKYIGTENNSYVFSVVYNNDKGEKFSLRIADDGGNILFTQVYTDKKFDKRFRLLKDDIDGKLNFIIKNLKDNSVQKFQVTTTSQIVEDVVVQKMND